MSETSRNEALHVLELDGEGPQPILETNISSSKSDASTHSDGKDANGGDVESSNATPNQKTPSDLPQGRQLGLASAVFLMANRIVGTGVFSTTSTILAQGGSVGMSLVYWLIGAVVAFAGFLVYAEFASGLPHNGGELNYLQHAYPRPRLLVTSMYAAQALLLGQAAGNAYTAGQYLIRAGGTDENEWGARGIGIVILVSAATLHGSFISWGLRFQNALGVFKLVVLLLIAFAGFGALAGRTRDSQPPDNFSNAFVGSRNDIYGIASCIYNAGWSYVGYSNLFYAIGEVRNPIRTIRIAGPVTILAVTILYELVQIAYFAAVPKDEILASKQIVAALFFKHMFGEASARALSVFVALSAIANVFAVVFSQGRLNQALGREGVIPFSKIFASNRPFKAPLAGVTWHVIVTLVILLAPPAGDAYNFVLNLSSYPLNVVNAAVGVALIAAYLPQSLRPPWAREWRAPIRATLPVCIFFTAVSTFLVIVPWIPPRQASDAVYEHMWYALAPAVSLCIFASGAIYWTLWTKALPALLGHQNRAVTCTLSDGTVVTEYVRDR